ncbi:insulin receptor substrate 1-like isoform X1 [Aphis craccivora]|uniref:Insulin receptor substrate 1 n=1 Tax=Aphis craccivora TaxID=307492 RepID=A0A6G0Z1C3_APHCR|nr:insulin receptor substrate 1-like isoform X1 [Aphis craccivora]
MQSKLLKMSLLLAQFTDSPKPKNAMAGVVKIGYLKKNKSMRKKFFVLREETAGGPARLEYYDTEKKWRNNALPKKVIILKSCFNIDKRVDARTKKTILCLYTKESSFCILFDCDKELDEWLDLMLVLRRASKDFGPVDSLKEPLEHIWHISILKKELGMNANLIGMTGLCLCDKKVSIMKYPTKSKEQKTMDIMLSSIRRCGALGTFFYMEVGQSSPFGSGHIWMDTWNNDVAASVHETIMGASSRNHDSRFRMRSSSFNEGSRLINCPSRQRSSFYDENHPGLRYKNNSQSSSTLNNGNVDLARTGSVRERCDSMPLRPRTISENITSSTRSFNGILSPKQTFHKGCNCVSASSSLSAFNDSNLSTWDSSFSKSIDTTDGISSFYTSLNDHRAAILEEKQEDFIPYTPLDKEEDSLKQTSDSNVNNNINLINNNIVGNKSSSSSQAGSCCDSNSPYGSPINVDDTYTLLNPSGTSGTSPPPDGYLPMKPGYTFSSNCVNVMPLDGHNNSKQESTEMPQMEFEPPEGYVPMAPVGRMSDYVSMDCKQGSIESGTPSTDTRFSDIHLDKVCAYLTPSEDEGPIERPTRAYSVGSRPDGLREKIDKINGDRTRARAFSVGSRGRLPPTGLPRNGYQSGSTSMSEQESDNGDRVEIDFSCNSKSRRHYSATCRTLSIQPPADLSPRSSPKLCPSPDPSCIHRPTGRSPPKSIVSSVDIKRTLSGAVHGISRSPPTSSHTYLSPTLERVSEVPSIEVVDSYIPMKPSQGLNSSENTNMVVDESIKRNYVNVWEAASSTFPIMKMIGGLNWKKNKKRNIAPALEQLIPMADEGIDEIDGYTTIRPGVHTIPVREQISQSSEAVLDAICDGLADLVFSDQPPIVTYNSQNHSKSDNSVSSLDG